MSFDALAPHYRWMESILAGEKLQRCRTKFLPEIALARNILLLGEGHGRCLVECCRRFGDAKITCIDESAIMLEQSRRQIAHHQFKVDQVQFIHADVLNWEPGTNQYDLVITNFFLDCFRADQLEQIISRISEGATPNASWLISDFQVAPAGLKRIRSQAILAMMYLFFRVVARLPARELTAPDSFLQRAGFTLCGRAETEWGLLHSDWWKRPSARAS